MKLVATVIAVVALGGGTADVLALRPHHRPARPQRGALVTVVLDDGTLLISKTD